MVKDSSYTCGKHTIFYKEVESLSYIPKTSVTLCVNYTQIYFFLNQGEKVVHQLALVPTTSKMLSILNSLGGFFVCLLACFFNYYYCCCCCCYYYFSNQKTDAQTFKKIPISNYFHPTIFINLTIFIGIFSFSTPLTTQIHREFTELSLLQRMHL